MFQCRMEEAVVIFPGGDEFAAHDDDHGREMEPNEEDDEPDERAVRETHGGEVQNIVAVSARQKEPDGGDEDGSDGRAHPFRAVAVRRVAIENRKGQHEREERKRIFDEIPRVEEYIGQCEIKVERIDDRVSENGDAQRENHGKDDEQREEERFRLHGNPGLLISVVADGFVRGPDDDIDTLCAGPQRGDEAERQPDGASSGDDTVDVSLERDREIGGQIREQFHDEGKLRRHEKEDGIHEEDHERDEAEDKIIRRFRRERRNVIGHETFHQAEHEKSHGLIDAHPIPPFRPHL